MYEAIEGFYCKKTDSLTEILKRGGKDFRSDLKEGDHSRSRKFPLARPNKGLSCGFMAGVKAGFVGLRRATKSGCQTDPGPVKVF